MKRWILLFGIVLLGVAAVVVSQRRKVDASASPASVPYLIADTEQELTRMPAKFTRMSDAEEIRIGDELARSYSQYDEESKNPEAAEIERYLKQVGSQLADHAHRKLPYQFHYISNPYFINAFALPGGHVFVGGGLLALMDSEDELASVLGHEIEHIDHYHCAERAQQQKALRKIPLGEMIAIPIEIFEAGYSKDQELEADREGTRLAVQAGYSANGAIRMFGAFQRRYNDYQSQPKSPQEEATQVAVQTLEGYFRSHPLASERIAQVQQLIADNNWPVHAERDLLVGYITWIAKARDELTAHRYQQAEQIASHSLKLKPDQERALQILADAQFAQAEFAAAAASYRKFLDIKPSSETMAQSYAQALAASEEHKRAASDFRRWLDTVKEKPTNSSELVAGLTLLAGDPAPANKLRIDLQTGPQEQAPIWLSDLGWWYYLAGDYEAAETMISAAVQQRPGDLRSWVRRAWAEIGIKHYSDALTTTGSDEERNDPEKIMAHAVAFWQSKQSDEALSEFNKGIRSRPEWDNPQWVKALYSPLVAQSVQEMHAERERREKAHAALKR